MKKKRKLLEKRLKAYSAAAAGTLLLAPSANAAIQYSGPQNLPVSVGNDVMVDMDGDTNVDARVWINYTTSFINFINLDVLYQSGSSFIMDIYNTDPANLPSNYVIQNTLAGPNTWWSGTGYDTLAGNYYGITLLSYGNFNTLGSPGYIGIRFPAGCGTAYGWIQYRTDTLATQGTVIDWAYEDTCAPILAGAGAPLAVPVPTFNQWGILILIALLAGAAVMKLRKQEEA